MKENISDSHPEASPARRRLLDTATRLFYEGGIHAVGIDRIIAEAGVAKATFYNHFPSKDDLVVAYIEETGPARAGGSRGAAEAASTENDRGDHGAHQRGRDRGRLAGLSVPQRGGRVSRPGQPRAAGHRCASRMVSRQPPGPSRSGRRSSSFRHRFPPRRRCRTACWKAPTWMIPNRFPPLSGKRWPDCSTAVDSLFRKTLHIAVQRTSPPPGLSRRFGSDFDHRAAKPISSAASEQGDGPSGRWPCFWRDSAVEIIAICPRHGRMRLNTDPVTPDLIVTA